MEIDNDVKALMKRAKTGDAEALLELAQRYVTVQGIYSGGFAQYNFRKSARLFSLAARTFPLAKICLATHYANGAGVKWNGAKAYKLYSETLHGTANEKSQALDGIASLFAKARPEVVKGKLFLRFEDGSKIPLPRPASRRVGTRNVRDPK
jgi:TPR repeat protein